jgi:hypothetical protein
MLGWLRGTRALLNITSTQRKDAKTVKLKEDRIEIRRALQDDSINQKILRQGTFVKIGNVILFHRSIPTKPNLLEWDPIRKTYRMNSNPLKQKDRFMIGDFIFEYQDLTTQ